MATQKLVVVTEVAPKLKEFDGPAAMKFLREYEAYENRLDDTEAQVQMRQCLEPVDLEALLQCSEDMEGVEVVRRAGTGRRGARTELRTPRHESPVPPLELDEDEEKKDDEDDERDEDDNAEGTTVPEVERVVRLSNAHIELMLIHVLGPASDTEATGILRRVAMKDDAPFAKLSTATSYVQEWKIAMRWCQRFLPRQKILVKFFLAKVKPKQLAYDIENLGMKKIEDVFKRFVAEYLKRVNAKKLLTGMDVLPAELQSAKKAIGKSKVEDIASQKKEEQAKKVITCYKCGKEGHRSFECPSNGDKKPGSVKKIGSLLQFTGRKEGPYLAVDVSGEDQDRTMRLMAYADSGAEADVVGQKWVRHLELHGGVTKRLETPVEVEWLDKKSTVKVEECIELVVNITECEKQFKVTFLIVPWDIDYVVIGWDSLTAQGLLKNLEDILQIQKRMNVALGMVRENENFTVEDMDGKRVTSDSLRWTDDETPPDLISVDESDTESVMNAEQKREQEDVLEEYTDVFEPLPAGSAQVEPMTVTMRGDYVPPPMMSYRKYAPKVEAAIEMELESMLDSGVIEESDATYGCPVQMVVKEDSASGYRFCTDYNPINAGVVTTPFPLPPISMILLSLAAAVFLARLDLKSGYWQFPVDEAAKQYLAFFALGRMYTYRVVPMGFVQSSFHVQRCMYTLFAEHFGRGVFVYLDDIIIYANTWAEYIFLLQSVLSILRKAKLYCKRAKCAFGLASIEILGHVVSRKGVEMSERRKEAVLAVPFPQTSKALRSFLGMTNYMRSFVPKYAWLAKPLSREVNTPVAEWPREAMREAFAKMKTAVAEQLSLHHLDYSVPVVLQTDASTIGVGASLINRFPTYDRVVGCCSHAFTEAESRWKTIEQEAFAIIFAILYWRAVLWGHHFVIETDHRNLTFIHSGTSAKVSRWSLLLQGFSYSISFLAGELNVVADTLSRAPARMARGVHAVRISDFVPTYTSVRRMTLGAVCVVGASMEQGRQWFMEQHNDTVGHLGLHAVMRKLQSLGRTWNRMSRDVARWIHECPECQKYRLGGKPVATVPSPIASFQIFEELGIDFLGPLPRDTLLNCYICNIVCMTTHYCELFAVEAATAVVAAHCLLSVVARYGCFRSLRSDRGSHFVNEIIDEFLRLFEIQRVLTLPERPQANAIVERNGGEVTRHLRALVAARDLRPMWSVMLPLAQRIINHTWKRSIGTTPHQLLHWAPTDLDRGLFTPFGEAPVIPPLKSEYVLQLQQAYERLLDETSLFVIAEQDKVLAQYVNVEPTDFEVGSYVLMSYLTRPPSKLSARWAGPFRIAAKEGNNVQLEDLTGGPTKTVDVSRLKHFTVAPGVDVQAVAAADLGEAQVQDILAHRGSARDRAKLEFQVQWTDGDTTWEPWDRVRKLAAVDAYIRAYPRSGLKSLLQK